MNIRIIIAVLFFTLFMPSVHAEEGQFVDPDEAHPGEVKRPITAEQSLEIAQIHKSFADVDMLPLDEWLDGFRRDENPDREIAVWKHIAQVYTDYLNGRHVSPEYKKEVFKLLVASSAMPRDHVPENTALKILSAKEIITIMDLFYGAS